MNEVNVKGLGTNGGECCGWAWSLYATVMWGWGGGGSVLTLCLSLTAVQLNGRTHGRGRPRLGLLFECLQGDYWCGVLQGILGWPHCRVQHSVPPNHSGEGRQDRGRRHHYGFVSSRLAALNVCCSSTAVATASSLGYLSRLQTTRPQMAGFPKP
jgi:hypothetical protein